jgi:putative phage-type endonuclease
VNTEFLVIELQQGTSQWLAWRHKGIGASEASTIMGENRFKSASTLLQEKRGPVILDSFQNEAMALGTRLEPEARKHYIAKTGKDVRPVCVQSSRYDWLRASLDGLSTNHDTVVEIKCGASVYLRVSQSRSVPDYYYGQVQHILAVTGLDSLDFWCYWPDNPALLLSVERDDTYIQRLLSKESEFWNLINQNNTDGI